MLELFERKGHTSARALLQVHLTNYLDRWPPADLSGLGAELEEATALAASAEQHCAMLEDNLRRLVGQVGGPGVPPAPAPVECRRTDETPRKRHHVRGAPDQAGSRQTGGPCLLVQRQRSGGSLRRWL